MVHLPTLPDWNGLHPLIVHFPIALLLVAPLFVLLGATLSPERGRAFLLSALILMAIGTASIFVATETGEAAGKLAGEAPQIKLVLEQHQELAETTRVLFLVLTVAFATLLLLSKLQRRELSRTFTASLLAAFLLLYSTGALFLANTAHQGARLVHELGVSAGAAAPAPQALSPGAGALTSTSASHVK